MKNKNYSIYFIKNKKTKTIYVGQTKNFSKRLQHHLIGLRKGKHENHLLQEDWNKYLESDFEYFVEVCDLSYEESRENKRTFA